MSVDCVKDFAVTSWLLTGAADLPCVFSAALIYATNSRTSYSKRALPIMTIRFHLGSACFVLSLFLRPTKASWSEIQMEKSLSNSLNAHSPRSRNEKSKATLKEAVPKKGVSRLIGTGEPLRLRTQTTWSWCLQWNQWDSVSSIL